MPRQYCRGLGALLVLAVALNGCGGDHATRAGNANVTARTNPRVSEQSTSLRQSETPTRKVAHGDTLYSIAWETGRDYRALAAWNRIKPPYTIKPGQELRVTPPPESEYRTVMRGDTLYDIAGETGHDYRALAAWNRIKPPYTIKPGQKLRVTPPEPEQEVAVPAAKSPIENKTASAVASPATAPKPAGKTKTEIRGKAKAGPVKYRNNDKSATSTGSWLWPADGPLLRRYSDSDAARGIDIGGTRGQPVRACANGRVVYQGSGLRGYGQLIIVKHNNEFLSAYAHNDRIHVREGDVVKRGQKIADMGSTGADRVKLHFEIRRQGTPIDPLKYLPKR